MHRLRNPWQSPAAIPSALQTLSQLESLIPHIPLKSLLGALHILASVFLGPISKFQHYIMLLEYLTNFKTSNHNKFWHLNYQFKLIDFITWYEKSVWQKITGSNNISWDLNYQFKLIDFITRITYLETSTISLNF